MLGKFKVIHLVGSTKGNKELFEKAEKVLTSQGNIVFKPVLYGDEVTNDNIDMLNEMCYQKLVFADAICIVTPEHIGESTQKRIQEADELNKEIFIYMNKKFFQMMGTKDWNELIKYKDQK